MAYSNILQRLDDLRDLINNPGEELSQAERRQILKRMEQLADRLSYDDSGYGQELPRPVVPPRHDRLTSDQNGAAPTD